MFYNTMIGAKALKMIKDTHQTTNFIISSWMRLENISRIQCISKTSKSFFSLFTYGISILSWTHSEIMTYIYIYNTISAQQKNFRDIYDKLMCKGQLIICILLVKITNFHFLYVSFFFYHLFQFDFQARNNVFNIA